MGEASKLFKSNQSTVGKDGTYKRYRQSVAMILLSGRPKFYKDVWRLFENMLIYIYNRKGTLRNISAAVYKLGYQVRKRRYLLKIKIKIQEKRCPPSPSCSTADDWTGLYRVTGWRWHLAGNEMTIVIKTYDGRIKVRRKLSQKWAGQCQVLSMLVRITHSADGLGVHYLPWRRSFRVCGRTINSDNLHRAAGCKPMGC